MTSPAPGTVCVLGAGGFIGSHLSEGLLRAGRRVVGVDRESAKVEHLLGNPAFDFRRFDVRDAAQVNRAVADAAAVVNLASLCNPSLYSTRGLEVVESNYLAALPAIRACRERGRPLVQFSTCEVYGRTLASYLPEGSPAREDPSLWVLSEESTPLVLGPVDRTRWSYAAAKQLLERVIVAEGKERGLRWSIVRPFNFLGARMDYLPGVEGEGTPRVLACFLAALLRGEPLPLVDGGQARRCFTAVEDAVDATIRILDRPGPANGLVFNVGNPANETTIADLAVRMIRAWEEATGDRWAHGTRSVPAAEFYGEGYEDSDRRVPDIARARKVLGWEPRLPLDQVLRAVVGDAVRVHGARLPG